MAGEVKALAGQTAQATAEVRSQIADIVETLGATARVVSDMRSRFSAVEALGTALERALGQQGDLIGSARSHAREASSRTGELQLGVARAEEDSHRTSNLAGELGAAATALVERAERLQLASARFVAQLETA